MLDVAIRLRPSFASMALMGFARGGSWASILCRLRPQMFRCVIVLGGYPPSPGTDEQQQQEEAAAVCAAVDNVMVVMSKADCLSPPNACAKWLRVLLWNGAHIVVGEDTLAQETLEEIHALLLDV
jgi:predicted esterase